MLQPLNLSAIKQVTLCVIGPFPFFFLVVLGLVGVVVSGGCMDGGKLTYARLRVGW